MCVYLYVSQKTIYRNANKVVLVCVDYDLCTVRNLKYSVSIRNDHFDHTAVVTT